MGAGLKVTSSLATEQSAMKSAISTALVTYWDEMETKSKTSTPSTKQEYADEFAEVLAETMFPRILDYVIANANFTATALGGVIAANTISVTPTVTVPKALAPAAVFEIVNVLSSVLAIPIPEPGANITSSVKRLEAVNLSTAFVLPSSAADIE